MSHAGAAPEEVAETNWPHENATAEEVEVQPVVEQQDEYEIEGIGGDITADQGELDEAIVDEMEVDDEEYRTFVAGRDTQLLDNDDTVPEDWGNFDMDGLTVNDGHDSNLVYNQIEIQSGQLFHDKKHLQHAVKKWSFMEKKPFKVVISNPTTYDVKCLSPGCPWRVHGYLPKGENNFVASIVVGHSCKLSGTVVRHKNMTAEFVACVMYREIVKKTSISPFKIMLAISNRYT